MVISLFKLYIQDYNGLPLSLLVLHIQDYNGLPFSFYIYFKESFPGCHHNVQMLTAVFYLFLYPQGSMVNLPEEENTPEKRVNKIFDIMDKVSLRKTYLHV